MNTTKYQDLINQLAGQFFLRANDRDSSVTINDRCIDYTLTLSAHILSRVGVLTAAKVVPLRERAELAEGRRNDAKVELEEAQLLYRVAAEDLSDAEDIIIQLDNTHPLHNHPTEE